MKKISELTKTIYMNEKETDEKQQGDFVLVEEDVEEDSCVNDDSDIKDDDHEVELQYIVNSWKEDEELKTGYSFKGKKPVFVKAVENVKILLRKGSQKDMKNLKFKVLDSRKAKKSAEFDVEILKGTERGVAVLKVYGPNAKNECTMMMTKCKKHDALFVKLLALDIVQPLLNAFITGEGWKNLLNESKKKSLKIDCKESENVREEKNPLKSHLNKDHAKAEMLLAENVQSNKEEIITMDITEEECIDNMEVDESKDMENVGDKSVNLNTAEKFSLGGNTCKEIPHNLKHLVDKGSLEFLVKSDGACATNAAAAHIFNDQTRGVELSIIKNKHIDEHWHFYQNKMSFPCSRKVGVGLAKKTFTFADGEEDKFLSFLKSEDSAYLWSEYVDLLAMCNLYQMKIKVIKTLGDHDTNPNVFTIGPDSVMDAYKLIPSGVVPDMTLINYTDKHYNLVVQSERTNDSLKSNTTLLNSSVIEKLQILEKKVDESELTIRNLKLEVLNLRSEIAKSNKETELKSDVFECEICKICFQSQNNVRKHMEKSHKPNLNLDIVQSSASNVLLLQEPQVERFECTICEISFERENDLKNHSVKSHKENVEYNCHFCSFQGHDEASLTKHYKETNHDSSNEITSPSNTFNCHSCGESFTSKNSLMDHRRDQHKDQIKRCRYFLKGICEFEDETCWYRHVDSQNEGAEAKCSFCDEVFKSKSELIVHRKNIHAQKKVILCRDYQRGSCRYPEDECWYRHVPSSELKMGNRSSIFQNAQSMNHRPESMIIEKTMEMMQMLINQISSLGAKLQK